MQDEIARINESRLFRISPMKGKHSNWHLLNFEYGTYGACECWLRLRLLLPRPTVQKVVPVLIVGLRNDYNSPTEGSGDKLDFRVQKGKSTLPAYNITQIQQLLNRCMAQRRLKLYDLVCTWHNVIQHVFSSTTAAK